MPVFKAEVEGDDYRVCDCRSKSKNEVSSSRCRWNRVASRKNDQDVHLDEDGALGLSGRWWGSRADGRVEDTEVDEPGTWDALVFSFKVVALHDRRMTHRS